MSVGAGASVELDAAFDALTANYTELLHGIWDYSFDQPHQMTVCALDPADDPVSVCPTLSVLSRDTHQRGTFPNADKIYDTATGVVVDTTNGIEQLPMAANSAHDPSAVGTDATDNSPVTLVGNYGILYRMHLSTIASDGKRLGFLLNPRGGEWGGALQTMPGLTTGGVFLIPPSTGSVCCNTMGAFAGSYACEANPPSEGAASVAEYHRVAGEAGAETCERALRSAQAGTDDAEQDGFVVWLQLHAHWRRVAPLALGRRAFLVC